jgi:membrane protein YdbS with pleckstrin-like domain
MADRVIRPSTKQIKVLYVMALIVVLATVAAYAKYADPDKYPRWLPAIALIVLLVPIRRQIRRQMVKVTISGDKLRYDLGLLSKTTRNIQLSKVQDVADEIIAASQEHGRMQQSGGKP